MRIYDKTIHDQVFSKNVLWSNILRNVAHEIGAVQTDATSTPNGAKVLTVHYLRNVASAAGSETLTLPTAGNQGYLQSIIPMKFNFHQVGLTDVALQASKRSKEFLVNALESEYKGAREDMQRQLSRQGYGTGTGVICQVNGVGSSPTFDLDTPMVGKNPTDYFEVGNAVMFDSTVVTATTEVWTNIASITDDDTFVVTTGTGVADNDYVFLAHKAAGAPSVANRAAEVMGLKGLIDDSTNLTTLQGISRSSYIWWKAYVDDSTSQRSLTDSLLHTTYLEALKKGNVKYALSSFDVFSAYGQLLTPDRRYTNVDTELKGGFKGVLFNGIPIVPDFDCPYDELYFIDPSTLSVEDLGDMSFIDDDGNILYRSSTSPSFNATLSYYGNLAISAPNKNSSLRDVVK